jgi:hypothetical protein
MSQSFGIRCGGEVPEKKNNFVISPFLVVVAVTDPGHRRCRNLNQTAGPMKLLSLILAIVVVVKSKPDGESL